MIVFQNLPPMLQKASFGLIIGFLGFSLVLMASKPLAYIITMSLGCLGLGISLLCFFIFFIRELRSAKTEQ